MNRERCVLGKKIKVGAAMGVVFAIVVSVQGAGTLTPSGSPDQPIQIRNHHVNVVNNNAQCMLANGNFSKSKPVKFKSVFLKKVFGLTNYNMLDLDIVSVLSDTATVTNAPLECSAVVYKLYATASQNSDRIISNLFDFNEPLPSRKILMGSKEYLQMAGMNHTNEAVRSYAFITLGTAFPGDEKLGAWIGEQYFFPSNPVHEEVFYLGVIRIGGFTNENIKLCIKDALHSRSRIKVLGAIQIIADNPDVYNHFLSDLIVVAREANTTFKGLGYVRSYRSLIKALRRYGKEVIPYKKHIELMRDNCSDNISRQHIDSYIKSLQ